MKRWTCFCFGDYWRDMMTSRLDIELKANSSLKTRSRLESTSFNLHLTLLQCRIGFYVLKLCRLQNTRIAHEMIFLSHTSVAHFRLFEWFKKKDCKKKRNR